MTLQFPCSGKKTPASLTVTFVGMGRSYLLYFKELSFLAMVSETKPKQHGTIQKIHILAMTTESQAGKGEGGRDTSLHITGYKQTLSSS